MPLSWGCFTKALSRTMLLVEAYNLLHVKASEVIVRVLSRRASVESVLDLAYVGTVLDVCKTLRV